MKYDNPIIKNSTANTLDAIENALRLLEFLLQNITEKTDPRLINALSEFADAARKAVTFVIDSETVTGYQMSDYRLNP